jgi:hypothetical protein
MAGNALGRRQFILGATLTTAAVATGGAVGLIRRQEVSDAIDAMPSVHNNVVPATQPTSTPLAAQIAPQPIAQDGAVQLATDLAAAQMDNSRLQGELLQAQQRIADLEATLGMRQGEVDGLRNELDGTTTQLGVLGGLIALYQQLDSMDVGDYVSSGMQEMAANLGAVVDDIPTVQETLATGRQLLQNLESEVPLVDGARLWLLGHVSRVSIAYASARQMLLTISEGASDILGMMADWTEKLLKWLPFGLGENTANLIDALANLLDVTPETTEGLIANVANPMELWLGRADEAATPLVDHVIVPLKNGVLISAENHLNRTATLRQDFQQKVRDPFAVASDNRDRIRASIDAYKVQHTL